MGAKKGNKNKKKGHGYEARVLNKILSSGGGVRGRRFYASLGETDIWWVDKNGHHHEAQCKYSTTKPMIKPSEREKLMKFAKKFEHQMSVWLIMKSKHGKEQVQHVLTDPDFGFYRQQTRKKT